MNHIKTYYGDFPPRMHGLTVYQIDDDGEVYYTIVLNSGLSIEMQQAAYDHEMSHIENNDFDKMYNVDCLEALRHAS